MSTKLFYSLKRFLRVFTLLLACGLVWPTAAPAAFTPQEIFLVLIFVRGRNDYVSEKFQ